VHTSQIAAQLYTLRDKMTTPAEVREALHRLKQIGFAAVEPTGMPEPLEAALIDGLNETGLTVCAVHYGVDQILSNPDGVWERLNRLDCQYVVMPYPANIPMTTRAEVDAFAAGLAASGNRLAAVGKTLLYHHHDLEWAHVEGEPIFTRILAQTSPAALGIEADTYWLQLGGICPAAFLTVYAGRVPVIHLKDLVVTGINAHTTGEIGAGNLDWSGIIATAEQTGVKWFIIEQDHTPGDPFESLARSYAYVTERFCK
jgi:sugar phosphate isomerase/epimerase